jgi:hypothetical protein
MPQQPLLGRIPVTIVVVNFNFSNEVEPSVYHIIVLHANCKIIYSIIIHILTKLYKY